MMRSLALVSAAFLGACASGAPAPIPTLAPPPIPPGSYASPVIFGQLFDDHSTSVTLPRVWADNGNLAPRSSGTTFGLYTPAYRLAGTVPAAMVERRADGSVAYEFGDTRDTPFDFHDPAGVALKEAEISASLRGQTWLSIDNVDVANSYHEVGVAGSPRYTGGPNDPVWIADDLAYIATLTAWGHQHGLQVMLNDAGGSTSIAPADWESVAAEADGAMQEGFPLDACYADDTWTAGRPTGAQFDREYAELVSQRGVTWMAAYLCSDAPGDAANADNDAWVVAAYLLAAKPGDVVSLSTTAASSAPVAYPDAMKPPIGAPVEPPPPAGSRPYVRRFAGGVVYLNASPSSAATVVIPAGAAADQFGNRVTPGPRVLAPMSALIVLGTP